MKTKKEFQEWFDNSPLKDACNDDKVFREAMEIAFEKGAESVKNSVLELLLMGDK